MLEQIVRTDLRYRSSEDRMYAAADVLTATGSLSHMELPAGVQRTRASSSEAGPAGKCYPGSDGGGMGAFIFFLVRKQG